MNTKIDSIGQVNGILNVDQTSIRGNVLSDGQVSGEVPPIDDGQINGVMDTGQTTINGSVSSDGQISGSVFLPPTSGSGTSNYNKLINKPSIEHVELVGNKSFSELGLSKMTADDLLRILT